MSHAPISRLAGTMTAFALLALFAAGCGSPTTAALSGSVTVEGKPLPQGTVTVQSEDGRVTSTGILDGAYKFPDAPLGKVQFLVRSNPVPPMMAPPDKAGGKAPAKREFVKINDRYSDFKTSELSTTVEAGKQNTYDILLK